MFKTYSLNEIYQEMITNNKNKIDKHGLMNDPLLNNEKDERYCQAQRGRLGAARYIRQDISPHFGRACRPTAAHQPTYQPQAAADLSGLLFAERPDDLYRLTPASARLFRIWHSYIRCRM